MQDLYSDNYTANSEPADYAELIEKVDELSNALRKERKQHKRSEKKLKKKLKKAKKKKGKAGRNSAEHDVFTVALDSLPAALSLTDTLLQRKRR